MIVVPDLYWIVEFFFLPFQLIPVEYDLCHKSPADLFAYFLLDYVPHTANFIFCYFSLMLISQLAPNKS